MTKDAFWELIDAVNRESGGDMDRKCALLTEQLAALDAGELRAFIEHFDAANAAAFTWPLWGAAYVLHGGCSDDSFSDFRATLVSQGREVYEAALADPESLADLGYRDEEEVCYEGFQYAWFDLAEEKLGGIPDTDVPFPDMGEEWEEDDLDDLYPRLTALMEASAAAGSDGEGERETGDKKPWWKFW